MSTMLDLHTSYFEAFNDRDFDAVRTIIHPDIVDHHLPPDVPAGADGVIGWLELLASTMTIHCDIQHIVDCGDRVAGSGRITGVHVGDFPGMPATNRPFDVAIITVERFDGDRIVERWETFDRDDLVAQLMS